MWTLILITTVVSGAATGGVAASTAFLDFTDETKCRAAAEALAGTHRMTLDQSPNHPNISPPATYRILAQCVAR